MSVTFDPKDITNIEHQINGKCVCEACRCGKHKCPSPSKKGQFHSSYNSEYPKYENYKPQGKYNIIHKNFILPQDKFYGQSSYTNDYNERNKTIQHAEKFKPKGELELSKDPFNANTSYIEDYLNKGKGQRAERITHPKNHVLPEGKFSGDSQYHQNYLGGSAEKQKQFRPIGQLKVGGNFQGKSSYLHDYENKGAGGRAQRVPLPKNHILPEGHFDGNSNYTHDYISSTAERPKQFRPEGQLKLDGRFQGSSSYNADFQNKGKPLRAERVPLPKNQVIPQGKFQGDSNYHQNYIPGKIERQGQFKPEGQLKVGGDAFSGQSSYIADYLNRGAGQKAQRVLHPKNQIMPEGKFVGDSNYKADFIPGKSERQQQFKPQGELKVGGSFEGTSSYGNDYLQRGMGLRSQRVPLPKNYVIPEGKFQGNSAYIGDYMGTQGDKNPQFRPHGELKVGEGKFQGNSSYSNDYLNQGKPIRAERVPLPKNQVLPEGKFSEQSTYHGDFIPGKGQKSAQFKPQQQLKVGGSFSGFSSYGEAYSPKKIQKQICPCDKLASPRYQTSPNEHLRYNEQSHRWQ